MRIVSYNVNGIRAAIKKGLFDYIKENDFDIVCFQETKSQPEQVDLSELESYGYNAYWHSAEKKGYSGVLTISKQKADNTVIGLGIEKYDSEGRVIRTDFGDWSLLNCYFPSGSSGEERHAFKMDYLNDFRPWVENFLKDRPNTIIVGDYNVVHRELDIHNPTRKDNPSGYRPEERAWMDRYFEDLFTDAFRAKNPELIEFSWWSYRSGARAKNKGWRIDYQAVSKPIEDKILNARHDEAARHSDHCPLIMEIDL